MSSFFYCFRQGIKNISRNRLFSIASVATMTVCIFLFGVMYFVMVNVRYNLLELEEELVELKREILKIDGVRRIDFISAEHAWENFKEAHFSDADSEMLASFGEDNPLENSSSFEIYFSDIQKQPDAIETIRNLPGIRYVNNADDLVQSLNSLNRGVSIGMIVLIVLLLAIALFLISTAVSLGVAVRAKEIQIQSLIGATDLFIRGPFLVEGILIGFLGAAIPLSFLYALYYKLVKLIDDPFGSFGSLNFVGAREVFYVLAPVSLCIGVGIGFFGSFLSLSRQLRKFRKM